MSAIPLPASETAFPTRPWFKAAWPWLRPLLWSALIWSFFYLMLITASFGDYLRKGKDVNLLRMLWINLPYVLPLVFFNWLLSVYVERHREVVESPLRILRLVLAALPIGFVAMVGSNAAFTVWRGMEPAHSFLELLAARSYQDNLVDLMLIVGALIFQMAFSAWQRAQEHRMAVQRAQTDNLRLRLSLLQGQLEPHFLFNALNSISALVRASDRGSALTALTRVSELLRYALRASKSEWVSVQDELGFVRDYLELQQLRYGTDLQLVWQVEALAWERVACPPLLFQPLVENSIRHGLEAFEGAGQLEIVLKAEAGRVTLGLSNPVCPGGTGHRGHGLGLGATRERLLMIYGHEARVEAFRLREFFVTELTLPWRELDGQVDRTDR